MTCCNTDANVYSLAYYRVHSFVVLRRDWLMPYREGLFISHSARPIYRSIYHSLSPPSLSLYIYICLHIYIYIYIYHHVVPLLRISLTLSHHFSLLFIASGRSSGLHPVSSHSCCMYVRAGRPAFARPYVGVHRSTSLMSLSLLLQQCPASLVCLTWIVFVVGGWWPYSCSFVGCCRQD